MGENIAIKVHKVSKTFKLPHEKNNSIKGAVVNFYKRKKSYEVQQALKDISFDVKKGEFFGIVGRNGSGKSTLLKILAGIYSPTEGAVEVNGKITPFIELGVGFNMELTGRENVFLNGALLGFSRKEMIAMYDQIVLFAELERFMDQKLKNYSSGMQVRLAFSIAIRAKSDILIMDEVLAVGDAAFQQKCYDIFAELKKKGTTIVLVTHDMSAVLRFCDKAILIDNNSIVLEGSPKTVADSYLELNYDKKERTIAEKKDITSIIEVQVLHNNKITKSLEPNSEVNIQLKFDNPTEQPIHFGLQIFNDSGTYCFGTNTKIEGLNPTTASKGTKQVTVKLDLVPGRYSITVATMNENATTVLSYKPNSQSFRIMKTVEVEGISNLKHSWRQQDV